MLFVKRPTDNVPSHFVFCAPVRYHLSLLNTDPEREREAGKCCLSLTINVKHVRHFVVLVLVYTVLDSAGSRHCFSYYN